MTSVVSVYSVCLWLWRFAVALLCQLSDWIGRLLGFTNPTDLRADTNGDVWYAASYIYDNHWRPGTRAEAIVKPGPRWTSWAVVNWLPQVAVCGAFVAVAAGGL